MYKKYELTEDEIAFIESTIRVILENEMIRRIYCGRKVLSS